MAPDRLRMVFLGFLTRRHPDELPPVAFWNDSLIWHTLGMVALTKVFCDGTNIPFHGPERRRNIRAN